MKKHFVRKIHEQFKLTYTAQCIQQSPRQLGNIASPMRKRRKNVSETEIEVGKEGKVISEFSEKHFLLAQEWFQEVGKWSKI